MALLTKKIQASTLVEVMVAMVIISIAFGLGLMIYINVVNSDRQTLRLQAHIMMNELAEQTATGSRKDETIETEQLKIIKTWMNYKSKQNIQVMVLQAFDKNGREIAEQKQLVKVSR